MFTGWMFTGWMFTGCTWIYSSHMRTPIVLIAAVVFLACGFGLAQSNSGQSDSGQSDSGQANSGQADPSSIPQFSRKLIVAVKPLEPFVIKRGETLEGFSIDLWDGIAKSNGWAFEYKYLPTVKAVLANVQGGLSDVGIAGISMTDEREKLVDFSYPMFNAGLQIMVPDRASTSWQDALKNAFSGDLLRILGVMVAVIVFAGHVIWLVERRIDEHFPRAYLPGVGEGIWRAGINLATGGFGDRAPSTVVGRIVALLWVLFGIILISNFTAAVTTNLTVQQIQGNISGPNDLYNKRVLSVANTTTGAYLKAQNIPFKGVENVIEAYRLLETGKADALVYDSPVLLNYANTVGRGKVRVVGPIFKREFYGIALQPGSVLRESINRTMLDFTNGETYQKIYERWFGNQGQR
jgi:polar amino acid transport system substrate-binding protein